MPATEPLPGLRAPGSARPVAGLLVVGVLGLAATALVLGPDLVADDWVWIRNGEFLGWWDAGGRRQVGRPGAFALYALTFGVIGAHPLALAAVQVALWAAAGVAVLYALRELLAPGLALLVTAVWLATPGHVTLELWASTAQAWVAVILLAFGARALARAARDEQRASWPGFVALGAAGLFYEVALLAAPVIALAVDRAATGRWRRATWVTAAVATAPALLWAATNATVYTDEVGLPTTEDRWLEHLGGALGLGLARDRDVAVLVVVLAASAAAVAWLRRRELPPPAAALLAGGGAIAVAGVLPALRSYTVPFGMGDRLTAVSGLGAAMFWVGAGVALGLDRMPRRIGVVAAVAGLALALVLRVDFVSEWDDAGGLARVEAGRLAARIADTGDTSLVLPEPIAHTQRVTGLYDGWNTSAAVQVVSGDPDVVVQVDVGCVRSGPRPEHPQEQYGTRAELRVPGCGG